VSKHPGYWPQVALLTVFSAACATVVFEEPPSNIDEGGGGGTGPVGSAGQGGSGSIAQGGNTAAQGGRSGTGGAMGAAGSLISTPQGGSGSVSLGGTGNLAQGGSSSTPPPDPQFPSGMELLRDDFESGVDGWTPGGGTWALSLDTETNSNVYGQTMNTNGTAFVSANGDATWRDVRIELDFKVLDFNGSSTSYVAGACVRVSDAANFYLAGLRSDGRFGVRRFGDSNNNLDSSDDLDAVAGQWYHLRVDAIGSTLTLFLDGTQVVTMTDTSHAAGGVGVCTAHASAVFDNIVVTAP
jgi:hypothetical protein